MLAEITRADAELGGGPTGQDGDGVLELSALQAGIGEQGFRGGDLGIGGRHVAGRHRVAGFVLVIYDVIGFLVFDDRAREQRDQGIGRAQTEIGDGELSLRGELGIIKIGGARLRARRIGFDLPASSAPRRLNPRWR